jgi:hypothetical protein
MTFSSHDMNNCTQNIRKIGLQFNERERRHLLSSPGLGPVVVERLERSGIVSIDKLRSMGVDAAVDSICRPEHNRALFNRRRALLRAVDQYVT